MCAWLELLLFVVFGLLGLIKGEFKITGNRMVKGSVGRVLGVLLLLAGGIPLLIPREYSLLALIVRWGTLLLVIVIGLATSEKIQIEEEEQTSPQQ